MGCPDDMMNPEYLFAPDGGGKLTPEQQAEGQSLIKGFYDDGKNSEDGIFSSSAASDFEDIFSEYPEFSDKDEH